MKAVVNNILFYLLYAIWYTLSLLPMWFHHFMADVLYVLVACVMHYRRAVIRKNLANAFPEKSERERRTIERDFYHFFCDYIAETVKFATMSHDEMRRRMTFEGTEQINECMARGQSVAVMLGHYGNWEWAVSIRLWLTHPAAAIGHIYHPLENPAMNRLFLTVRNRMGSESVPMSETLRWILKAKREGKPSGLGYISDQVPLWQNIHHWVDFLNQDTPVFTGVERIARSQGQAVFYCDVRRVKRGYYQCLIRPITLNPAQMPEFAITDAYFSMLQHTICREPAYWLWSHNRWKRTREEFNRRFEVINGRVVERVKV